MLKVFFYLSHLIRTEGTKISTERAIRMSSTVTVGRCRVYELMLITVKVLDMR